MCMVTTRASLREEDGVGVCVGEGDWPTQGRGWACQDHLTGHVDVMALSAHLYRGGAKDDNLLLDNE